MRLAILKIRLQQSVNILHGSLKSSDFHIANGPPQQQRQIILLAIIGNSIVMFGLLIFLHQPQTVTLPHKCDLLMPINIDSFVKISQCCFVLLHFEEKFASVDIGFVVFRIVSDAPVELN